MHGVVSAVCGTNENCEGDGCRAALCPPCVAFRNSTAERARGACDDAECKQADAQCKKTGWFQVDGLPGGGGGIM